MQNENVFNMTSVTWINIGIKHSDLSEKNKYFMRLIKWVFTVASNVTLDMEGQVDALHCGIWYPAQGAIIVGHLGIQSIQKMCMPSWKVYTAQIVC